MSYNKPVGGGGDVSKWESLGKFFKKGKTDKANDQGSDTSSGGSRRNSIDATSSAGIGVIGGKPGSSSNLTKSFSRGQLSASGKDSTSNFQQLIKTICIGVDADNPSVSGSKLLSGSSVGNQFMSRFGDKLISLNKAIDQGMSADKKEKVLSELTSMQSGIEAEIQVLAKSPDGNLTAINALTQLKLECMELKEKIAPEEKEVILKGNKSTPIQEKKDAHFTNLKRDESQPKIVVAQDSSSSKISSDEKTTKISGAKTSEPVSQQEKSQIDAKTLKKLAQLQREEKADQPATKVKLIPLPQTPKAVKISEKFERICEDIEEQNEAYFEEDDDGNTSFIEQMASKAKAMYFHAQLSKCKSEYENVLRESGASPDEIKYYFSYDGNNRPTSYLQAKQDLRDIYTGEDSQLP